MAFKLSAAISIARGVLQDADATAYRTSNDRLVEIGNGALRSLASIRPEWFHDNFEFTCAAGALQALTDAYQALVDVRRVKGGDAVLPCDQRILDAFMPSWMSASAGAAKNWMPHLNDPRRFMVCPPAPENQVLEVTAVKVPGPYTIEQDTTLPNSITDAVAEYIVGIVEAGDDENVLAQRSAQFMTQFAARVSGQSKG